MKNSPIANLGDVDPIEYGGFFVFENGDIEFWIEPEDQDSDSAEWQVYRWTADKCTYVDGVLSDNEFHPEIAAWFACKGGLESIAQSMDYPLDELIADFQSDDLIKRGNAYRAVSDYHGAIEFDSEPLSLDKAEIEARYETLYPAESES